jgi:hypothetical protein
MRIPSTHKADANVTHVRRTPDDIANVCKSATVPQRVAQTGCVSSSWLFVRGRKCIWIERPLDSSLIIIGPGSARAHLYFMDEKGMQAYQVATAERLSRRGWFLWAFDRRRASAERDVPEP